MPKLTRRNPLEDARQQIAKDWRRFSTQEWGNILTGQFAHYCPDWDMMTIDETVLEYTRCTCNKQSVMDSAELIHNALDAYSLEWPEGEIKVED